MERRPMTWTETVEARFEYQRPPQAIVFPEEAEVPESKRHLEVRTLLFTFLKRAFGERAAIGSDQFVYFRAADPRRCVAPDAFIRLHAENDLFATWKVWERGAPHVAIEIASTNERPWADKLADYHEIGVLELVRFDPEAGQGERLRIWDRVEEDLVPRVIVEDRAASRVLGGTWCVAPGDGLEVALRWEDPQGTLFPSVAESEAAERAAKETERAAKEAERAAKEAERSRADGEQARANAEQGRANAEQARADALAEQLAALLRERGRR
jgi:hypothetical protein